MHVFLCSQAIILCRSTGELFERETSQTPGLFSKYIIINYNDKKHN